MVVVYENSFARSCRLTAPLRACTLDILLDILLPRRGWVFSAPRVMSSLS